jgi:hypothetical protein
LNRTQERIRQIRIKLEDKIKITFDFLSYIIQEDIPELYNYSPSNLYIIKLSNLKKINECENVNFNLIFYIIIFELIMKETHFNLSKERNLFGKSKFKYSYLIPLQYKNVFNFEGFMDYIYLKFNNRVQTSYELPLNDCLSHFWKDKNSLLHDNIYTICETIILKEFGKVINDLGYLKIPKNSIKQVYEYGLEVLEEASYPMTVTEIRKTIKEKYPDFRSGHEAFRNSMLNKKDIFIYFGRTSTYGLRKWESEKENIKGGTIRDIIEDFLNKCDEPQHILTILEHVVKFRGKNKCSNLISNLKLSTKQRYIFYPGGFIGLCQKKYKKEFASFKRISGGLFTMSNLRKYNNWDYDKFIDDYATNVKLYRVQIEYILKRKIDKKEILISEDNKLIIPEI